MFVVGWKESFFMDNSNQSAYFGVVPGVLTENYASAVWLEQSEEYFYGGCFSSAIGSD
jgi:hypothetical protein